MIESLVCKLNAIFKIISSLTISEANIGSKHVSDKFLKFKNSEYLSGRPDGHVIIMLLRSMWRSCSARSKRSFQQMYLCIQAHDTNLVGKCIRLQVA